jgi:hypothetical protein
MGNLLRIVRISSPFRAQNYPVDQYLTAASGELCIGSRSLRAVLARSSSGTELTILEEADQ